MRINLGILFSLFMMSFLNVPSSAGGRLGSATQSIFGKTNGSYDPSKTAPGVQVSFDTFYYRIYDANGNTASYYYSKDGGKTVKKANLNQKDIGNCDIPFLGLENGGFFEYKSDNKSTSKINVYQNTKDMSNNNVNGRKYCIANKYNPLIPGDWVSEDGVKFKRISDNKELYLLGAYAFSEDTEVFAFGQLTNKKNFDNINSNFSSILKCNFYLGKNLDNDLGAVLCLFGRDSKTRKRYFISSDTGFKKYTQFDKSGKALTFSFDLDSNLLKDSNLLTYSDFLGYSVNPANASNSPKLLYISSLGDWYLSTDKGITFNKVDKNGKSIGKCDIPYFGLTNGGFDSRPSSKANHKNLSVFTDPSSKVYSMVWNSDSWISFDGVIFRRASKITENNKNDICFVLNSTIFYSGWNIPSSAGNPIYANKEINNKPDKYLYVKSPASNQNGYSNDYYIGSSLDDGSSYVVDSLTGKGIKYSYRPINTLLDKNKYDIQMLTSDNYQQLKAFKDQPKAAANSEKENRGLDVQFNFDPLPFSFLGSFR